MFHLFLTNALVYYQYIDASKNYKWVTASKVLKLELNSTKL